MKIQVHICVHIGAKEIQVGRIAPRSHWRRLLTSDRTVQSQAASRGIVHFRIA
jgi:hypothetical protein